MVGAPCSGEPAALGVLLPGGGSSAERRAVAARCSPAAVPGRAWSLRSLLPRSLGSSGALKRLPPRPCPPPVRSAGGSGARGEEASSVQHQIRVKMLIGAARPDLRSL